MKSTSHCFEYYDQEDVDTLCRKCRNAFYGDWSIQDCDYCIIPKLLEKIRQYAEDLDSYAASGL